MVESIGKLGWQFQMLLRHNNFYIILLKYTQNSYESMTLPAECHWNQRMRIKKGAFSKSCGMNRPKVAE